MVVLRNFEIRNREPKITGSFISDCRRIHCGVRLCAGGRNSCGEREHAHRGVHPRHKGIFPPENNPQERRHFNIVFFFKPGWGSRRAGCEVQLRPPEAVHHLLWNRGEDNTMLACDTTKIYNKSRISLAANLNSHCNIYLIRCNYDCEYVMEIFFRK